MRPLLTMLACFFAVACSDVAVDVRTLTELEKAERRWESLGPESYVYAVRVLCFCPVELTAPVRVLVDDEVAVERTYVGTGLAVPPAFEDHFPTVEGLFDMLRRAYADDADEVIVAYHPELGFPIELSIDYDVQLADEEITVTVVEAPSPVLPVNAPASPTPGP